MTPVPVVVPDGINLGWVNGGRDFYDVVTALRGPDLIDADPPIAAIKEHLTRRIRGIVFEYDHRMINSPAQRCEGSITSEVLQSYQFTELEETLNAMYAARDQIGHKLRSSRYHVLSHLYHALMVTQNHPIWGIYGVQLVHSLSRWL